MLQIGAPGVWYTDAFPRQSRYTRLDIKILDTAGHGPVYEQIRSQIAAMIEGGELTTGSELPKPHVIATQCGVDRGEVQRAYFELEQAGLLVSKKSKNFLGESTVTFRVV